MKNEHPVSRSYVYTITNVSYTVGVFEASATAHARESAPTAVSSIAAGASQTVTVSGLSTPLSGGATVTSGSTFRVYRKDAGAAGYRLVAEVPISQSSVSDPIGTTVLGQTLSHDASTSLYPTVNPAVSVSPSAAA